MTLKFREVQWLNQGHTVKGRVEFKAVSPNFMCNILSMTTHYLLAWQVK